MIERCGLRHHIFLNVAYEQGMLTSLHGVGWRTYKKRLSIENHMD